MHKQTNRSFSEVFEMSMFDSVGRDGTMNIFFCAFHRGKLFMYAGVNEIIMFL